MRSSGRCVFAAFGATMAFSTLPTPLYPLYAERYGYSPVTIALVFAAYAAGVTCSLLAGGPVSDRVGRLGIIQVGVGVNVVAGATLMAFPHLPGLIAGRVLSGLAVGIVAPAATAYLGDVHPPRRAEVSATVTNLGGLGVGALAAGALAQWLPHPLVLPYVVGTITLVVALIGLSLTSDGGRGGQPAPARREWVHLSPGQGRTYAAAAMAALSAFGMIGFFTSFGPHLLATSFHQHAPFVAGLAAFVVLAAAGAAPLLVASERSASSAGRATATGLTLVAASVAVPAGGWLLFLLGGTVCGAAAGLLFRGGLLVAAATAGPAHRAGAASGVMLAAYAGLGIPVVGLSVAIEAIGSDAALLAFAAATGAIAGLATHVLAPWLGETIAPLSAHERSGRPVPHRAITIRREELPR